MQCLPLATTLLWMVKTTGLLKTPGGLALGSMGTHRQIANRDCMIQNKTFSSSLCRYFWIARGRNMCGLADCASYPVV